jgi:eukaryotic-like serine/threonine-protein kinase
MRFDDPRLLDLADVVAEGGPVAWDQLEAEAGDPSTRSLIRHFRLLAQLADLHRASNTAAAAPFAGSAEAVTTNEPAMDEVWHWGPFEVRERIGAGGFGTVYRAWDPSLRTHVALKLLHPDLPSSRDREDSLVEEAQRLAQVRHPNVIVVRGADRHRGLVGFWMELIRGRTLDEVMQARGVFGAREAGLIGIDMCQALAAVHHSGLVHGDLKARNVMREEGGRHVLMDFGAALELRAAAARASHSLVGTPAYMAPEVLAGDPVTPQSDIYSLGVLLFHLVSNEFPVHGASTEELRTAHRNGERRRLRDVRPDLPSVFVQAVERALSPDPSARFGSAGAMEDALQATLSQKIAPAARTAGERKESASGRVVPRRTVVTLAGLAAVGLVAAIAWLLPLLRVPAGESARIQTIAVLPFANLGGPEQQYFSDGMTELLITTLSELTSLRVISRTSVMQYQRSQKRLPEIARELRADAVVEGSILRSGDRVRLTAKLVHAASDTAIWGESLERTGAEMDPFALQTELVRSLAGRIRLSTTPREQQRLASAPRIDPAAQEEYLKGTAALEVMTPTSARKAVVHLESAVRLDPNYARAYAALSHAYWYLGSGLGLLTRKESYDRAREAAERALRLDPDLPRAHAALAQLKFYDQWDWTGASAEFRRAVELNPSDADARQQYGWFLAATGKLDEALDQMHRARELDPLSPSRRSPLAAVLYYSGRHAEAVEELRLALRANPELAAAHAGLGRAYAAQRRFAEAITELESASLADLPAAAMERARVYAEAGDRDRAVRTVREVEQRSKAGATPVSPVALASVYVALGEENRAFEHLDTAIDERDAGLVWLKVDPRFAPLRTHPRFAALVKRIGL